jgi:hypothetical protein
MNIDNDSGAHLGHTSLKSSGKQGIRKAQRINNPLVRPRLLTLKKAAEYLGIGYWAMRRLAWDRAIPVVQFPNGRKMYFDIVDLDEVIRRNKTSN